MAQQSGFIDAGELKKLSKLQPWRMVLALAIDWAVIIAAITVSEWSGNWLVWLVAVPVIGGRMHGFGGLIHDFAHYRFIHNKKITDWVGDLLFAWPILATIDGYRLSHLGHHRYLNTSKDPDWQIKFGTREFTFPQEMRYAIFNFLGYFTFTSSLRDMRSSLTRIQAEDPFSWRYKMIRHSFHIALAIILTVTGTWTQYFLYWLVPAFTFFLMFMYIRSVADHFGETMNYDEELQSSRTVIPYFWERWFFCPHNLCYHLEHHLYPSVPFYNLPKLHKALMANKDFAAKAHMTRGFVTGLFREVWLDGWRGKGQGGVKVVG